MTRSASDDHAPRTSRSLYGSLLTRRTALTAGVTAASVGAFYAIESVAPSLHAALARSAVPLLLGAGGVAAVLAQQLFARLVRADDQVARLHSLKKEYGLAEDLALLGSWTYDVAADRYQWSAGTFRVFGVEPKLGAPSRRGFLICVHAEDQQRWQHALRHAIQHGEKLDIEFRYIKDGRHTIWVRGLARPEFDEHGRVVRLTGIAQDTTHARSLAAQLADSEAKFRDLTRMSADWHWETDASHRLSYLSETAEIGLGGWVRDWIGKREWELPAASFPPTDWHAHRALLDERRPFERLRFTRIDPDGNLVHIELAGRPLADKDGAFVGYRGVGRNITNERQQQVLLRIETEIAEIMREQSDPERVVTALLITLCGTMGWAGGAHLVPVAGRDAVTVRERWGSTAFTQMLAELPAEIALSADTVEARSFTSGKAVWLQDVSTQPAFAARYRTAQIGMASAFVSPVLDEHGRVMSALLFMSPVGFRADRFVSQVAEILSRTLSLYLQRKAAEHKLVQASLHDALTGLPNRVYVMHQLETKLRNGDHVAVLYIDLDRYKAINDTLGHAAGDQVLIEVAQRFRDAIRPDDVAGRIGGDEFVLLLSNAYDQGAVDATARRLLAAVERPFVLQGRAHFLSASIGVAMAPWHGTDAALLLRCADSTMYQVKSEGRNGVRFYSADQSAPQSEPMQLAAELPAALRRGELQLHYEPMVDSGARRLAGIEAVLRWQHPTRGVLEADRFLPSIEPGSAIKRELEQWMLARAIHDRVALGAQHWDGAPVAVNVSSRLLASTELVGQLASLLTKAGLPSRLLAIELTEGALLEDPERAAGRLAEVRALGVRVIVDHFGTGYGSLASLKALAVDGLKIDRSFTAKLASDRGNAAVVRAVTTLADRLGIAVIADGVATGDDLQTLREIGCSVVQGPLIGEAVSIDRLDALLRSLGSLRPPKLNAVTG